MFFFRFVALAVLAVLIPVGAQAEGSRPTIAIVGLNPERVARRRATSRSASASASSQAPSWKPEKPSLIRKKSCSRAFA